MKINLTNKQYENLVKLVYLGNWMINAIRGGEGGEPQIEKYNEIEQYIYSFSKDFGLEGYVEFSERYDKFFPTRELEESSEIEKYREDYDNEIFWQELSTVLGNRDFVRKYGVNNIKKMEQKERFLKEREFIIGYEEEFEKHGIDKLEIRATIGNNNTTPTSSLNT